jgi:fructose-bisphosphate aldolase, class I
LIVLPVDQGFEHGPDKSFSTNPDAYDPEYHIKLAIEAGLNAYAAPLGMLESIADQYAGQMPLILKMNSSNALVASSGDQAITANIKDAIRLGCSAIGFTIYPGSLQANEMIEEIAALAAQAKESGLAVVIWAYPRGPNIPKSSETSLDVIAYSAHIAALLGAHIIKVKLPDNTINNTANMPIINEMANLAERVAHIKRSAFAGKRIVLFSGGITKDLKDLYQEIVEIKRGGGNGSIIGRNVFQRNKPDALSMLAKMVDIYLG